MDGVDPYNLSMFDMDKLYGSTYIDIHIIIQINISAFLENYIRKVSLVWDGY